MGISSPLGDRRRPFYKRLEIKALVVAILENVARGAVQGAADGVKGREADGLGFAGLEDREVGNRDSNAFAQFIELSDILRRAIITSRFTIIIVQMGVKWLTSVPRRRHRPTCKVWLQVLPLSHRRTGCRSGPIHSDPSPSRHSPCYH